MHKISGSSAYATGVSAEAVLDDAADLGGGHARQTDDGDATSRLPTVRRVLRAAAPCDPQ
ncbi:MAG: hypothetical protein HY060_02235 [Proteobacteria bacterium]|nr:hypothetical protein [Pseudomonadota bacterium]